MQFMKHLKKFVLCAVPLLLLFVAVGCGNGVYPVKGKITFEGKPMRGGGSIAFVPLGDQAGKTAGGEIDENGNYQLMTHKSGDGSMPGEFRVVITQVTVKEPEASPDGKAPIKVGPHIAAKDMIPPIYSSYESSPLKATVEAKSLNELDFDLKRNAQPPQGAPGGGAQINDPFRKTFAWITPPAAQHPLLGNIFIK